MYIEKRLTLLVKPDILSGEAAAGQALHAWSC
jgi:hypothetical protein